MKVYIVTEIASRELIGNLILAAILASRGHVAIILNQEDAFALSRGSISGTTIFHAKSLHGSKDRIRQHEKLRMDGLRITSMDQENAILNPAAPAFLSGRFCEENLKMAERVYTWNQLEAEELSKLFPEFAHKFIASGSPRVDSWGVRFCGLRGFSTETRRQILLTPSVSMNDSLRHWEHMAIAKTVFRLGAYGDGEINSAFRTQHDELRSQVFFSRLALMLADAFPDCDVTIQPKKNEIRQSWIKSLFAFDPNGDGSRRNLYIEYSRLLEESVHRADVVVNSTSTAGLTALIARIPLVSFGPTESMASRLGAQVETVEEGLARVTDALAEPERFLKAYEIKNFEVLGNRITLSDSRLAAELIVDDMELIDEGVRSRITARDFLLYLYPGGFRRMFSALKALMKLERPVTVHPQMVEKVSQARINGLLGRIVDGIGLELEVKARVASGRNIVVTARI